jgi:hypothetical protein
MPDKGIVIEVCSECRALYTWRSGGWMTCVRS